VQSTARDARKIRARIDRQRRLRYERSGKRLVTDIDIRSNQVSEMKAMSHTTGACTEGIRSHMPYPFI
jgi:hypothetical protein